MVLPELQSSLELKLGFIKQFMREACQDPDIRTLADKILCQAGPFAVRVGDPLSEAAAVFVWQQQMIPFEADPLTGEVADIGEGVRVHGPVDMVPNAAAVLERGTADCVGQTVLFGGLLCARGIPVRGGLQDIKGGGIDHVLLMVGIPAEGPQEWVPMDLTTHGPGQTRTGGPIQMFAL